MLGISPHYKNEPRGHGGLRPHGVDVARLVTSRGGPVSPPDQRCRWPWGRVGCISAHGHVTEGWEPPPDPPRERRKRKPSREGESPPPAPVVSLLSSTQIGVGGWGLGGQGASGTFRLGGVQVWTPPLPGGLGSRPPRPGGALPTPSLPPVQGGGFANGAVGEEPVGVCVRPPRPRPLPTQRGQPSVPRAAVGGLPQVPGGLAVPHPCSIRQEQSLTPQSPCTATVLTDTCQSFRAPPGCRGVLASPCLPSPGGLCPLQHPGLCHRKKKNHITPKGSAGAVMG